jgi:hypothetical protein
MSDFALSPPTWARPDKLVRSRRESASFGDLVNARWYSTKAPADEAERARYDTARALFEAEHGKIVDDYWSTEQAAGVALCCKRLSWGRLEWSLHRSMGSLAAGHPEYSPLLLHVARQSVRASNILRGMTQRIAISNLFSLSRDIMTSLESKDGDPGGLKAYQRDLHEIVSDAREAGAREAQVVYLKGLMKGVLALIVLVPALAMLFSSVSVPDVDSTLFVGCLIAGSLGAVMSVLMRMSSGNLKVSHEFGREYLANLGFARPFIGAIFALLLYFAFKGNLLQQVAVPDHDAGEFAFFVTSGFLIGFSERFAKEIVRTAESTAGGSQSAVSATAAAPAGSTPAS